MNPTLNGIHRDLLRLIIFELPYQSIPSLLKVLYRARLIVKESNFWRRKLSYDFPKIVSNESRLKKYSEPSDRLTYLRVYQTINKINIKRIVDDIDNSKVVDRTQATNSLNKKRKLDHYLRNQCRARFVKPQRRAPMAHNWIGYAKSMVQLKLKGEDNQAHPVDTQFTKYYFGYYDSSGTYKEQIIYAYPEANLKTFAYNIFVDLDITTLNELIDLIAMLNNGVRPNTDIQPDDIIFLDPKGEISYLVYQDSTGNLCVDQVLDGTLRQSSISMLLRRGIHTRKELNDLYYDMQWTLEYNDIDLNMAENEAEYSEMKPGYYHAESKEIQGYKLIQN
jgi:hypothetical protein